MRIDINSFVKRQTPESRFTHFDGEWDELPPLVEENWDKRRPGYRDGVLLVPLPPGRFRTPVVEARPGMLMEASVVTRREGEEPFVSVVAKAPKRPAKGAFAVLYRRDVLEEENEADGDAEWQVISINSSPTEEDLPITPVAAARNTLRMPGGTDPRLAEKSKDELIKFTEEMARSIIFWSQHVMAEPTIQVTMTVREAEALRALGTKI